VAHFAQRIKSRQIEHLKDKRIVVVIDKWDAHSLYPSGHYVKELGKVGDKATETEALVRGVPWSDAITDRACPSLAVDPTRCSLPPFFSKCGCMLAPC